MLTRPEIEARIPHAGSMCLLDRVLNFDQTRIVCQAAAPTRDHPLADGPGVPAVATVEYAAQAVALHGALLDDAVVSRRGMLAKVTGVELALGWLDASSGILTVEAGLLARDAFACRYSFVVNDAQGCRGQGCLLIAFTRER